jgi:tripartite-type tricarboxylate transporter receptor subunit TctC
VLAPAGTPKDIVDKLEATLIEIIKRPESAKLLEAQGLDLYILSARQFDGLMKTELAKYGDIIKRANVKMEN